VLIVSWAALPGPAQAADAGPKEESLKVDGPALLQEWTAPVYPPAALKAKRSGMVSVRLIVDETGKVTAARALEESDAEFVEPALAAVRSWGFQPALESSNAVACCLDTLVTFSPAIGQQKARGRMPPADQKFTAPERSPAKPKSAPGGDYPDILAERKISGIARFACVVLPDGRAVEPRITAASHVDFVLPALRALGRWEFEPGRQGDLPLRSAVDGQMTFDAFGDKPSAVLAANGITAPDGSPPELALQPVFVTDPVWPLDCLLKGESGSATVEFSVTRTGAVTDVRVREATQPEFGQALAAAMEQWGFERPTNRTGSTAFARHVEFKAPASEDGDPVARLVRALGGGEIGGAKGLDEKITPIYRVAPAYPQGLKAGEKPAGRAEIEFIIDREGRARLPRIVSATQEEFGWAAATAVAQWVFAAPRRAGEPVDVKVRIPITFAPPAD
jgi:TonB family protein